MKTHPQKHTITLKAIKKDYLLNVILYIELSSIYFIVSYEWSKMLAIILLAHALLFLVTTVASIVFLILGRKYLRLYQIPYTFAFFLFTYIFYRDFFLGIYHQLAIYQRMSGVFNHVADILFMNSTYTFFLIITWGVSHQIYTNYKNSINIFKTSK